MGNKKKKQELKKIDVHFFFDNEEMHVNDIKPHDLSNCAVLPYISSEKIKPNEFFILDRIMYAGLFREDNRELVGITVDVVGDSEDEYDQDPGNIISDVNRAYPIINSKNFRGFFILPNYGIAIDYGITVGSDSLYNYDDYDDEFDEEEFKEIMGKLMSNQKPC